MIQANVNGNPPDKVADAVAHLRSELAIDTSAADLRAYLISFELGQGDDAPAKVDFAILEQVAKNSPLVAYVKELRNRQ